MRKPENGATISGRVYQHTLEEKVSKKGVTYIGGNIDVATDDAGLNIVTVTYVYVAPTYPAKGDKPERPNPNYATLQKIMNGKTVINDGDEALKVKLTPSLSVNDFPNREGEMVAAKRLEGGFANILTTPLPEKETDRNKFKADVLIYGTQYVEADEEKNIKEDYLIVKAYVFNFANAIMPIDFRVKSAGGIKYFESLEASKSNPIFTNVWGQIVSSTTTVRKETDASTIAFGEPVVNEYTRTTREWVITGATSENYEIGDSEQGITAEEIKQALSDREVHLAEVKKNAEDYAANKGSAATTTTAPAAAGGFNF